MFDAVRDGSVVIVGRGYGLRHRSYTRREHSDVEALSIALRAPTIKKRHSALRLVVSKGRSLETQIDEIIEIRLGGVTGDAGFFTMTEERRRELALPAACMRPVLTKARHLIGSRISRKEWVKLRGTNQPVWLFAPSPKLTEHPAVQAYLERDKGDGGCNRSATKINGRTPWYTVPLPRSPDGFMSGMSRVGPWICFKSMPRLSATNTLYTVKFKQPMSGFERHSWALALLTQDVRQRVHAISRQYPGGLLKVEPGQLARLRIRRPTTLRDSISRYREAVDALLRGDRTQSEKIAQAVYD